MTSRSPSLLVSTVIVLMFAITAQPVVQPEAFAAQTTCLAFGQTNERVCGKFLDYFQRNGGLSQYGFPISGEFQEVSDTDGKTYSVQYFERAIFESHSENQAPYDVLLSLLGNTFYQQNYPNAAPGQQANDSPGSIHFSETGKRLGGKFLEYWNNNGGLMQQGYPLSDQFQEKSALDGKTYTVQYFERAVFELHPENQPPYDVLLSQLGTFQFKRKYQNSSLPTATPTPDAWATLRQKPITLPHLAPGTTCPVTPRNQMVPPPPTRYTAEYGIGSGPLYPVAYYFNDGTTLNLQDYMRESDGWFGAKVRWIGGPNYDGLALIRGRQLDGAGEIRFQYDGVYSPDYVPEMALELRPGWNQWPAVTLLPGPGCYAYQVDGTSFSSVIIFKAIDGR